MIDQRWGELTRNRRDEVSEGDRNVLYLVWGIRYMDIYTLDPYTYYPCILPFVNYSLIIKKSYLKM